MDKKQGRLNGEESNIPKAPEMEGVVEETTFRKRLKDKFGEEYRDENLDDFGERYAKELDENLAKYQESEAKMAELLKAEPEFAEVVYDMVSNNMPFRAAIAKHFSQEDLIPIEGDDDYDAFEKARGERISRAKKKDELTRQIEENEKKSLDTIDRHCSEKNMSEDDKNAFIEKINALFDDLIHKNITSEMLLGIDKMFGYDDAVKEAERVGEIRGRNANIEAVRNRKQNDMNADGLPHPTGGGEVMEHQRKARSIFEIPERPKI